MSEVELSEVDSRSHPGGSSALDKFSSGIVSPFDFGRPVFLGRRNHTESSQIGVGLEDVGR